MITLDDIDNYPISDVNGLLTDYYFVIYGAEHEMLTDRDLRMQEFDVRSADILKSVVADSVYPEEVQMRKTLLDIVNLIVDEVNFNMVNPMDWFITSRMAIKFLLLKVKEHEIDGSIPTPEMHSDYAEVTDFVNQAEELCLRYLGEDIFNDMPEASHVDTRMFGGFLAASDDNIPSATTRVTFANPFITEV